MQAGDHAKHTLIARLLNHVARQQSQQTPAQTAHDAKNTPHRRNAIGRKQISRYSEEGGPLDLNGEKAEANQGERQSARRVGRAPLPSPLKHTQPDYDLAFTVDGMPSGHQGRAQCD